MYTLWVKNLVRIALSRTISKMHNFLHFMQNFKMATKSGGKMIFGKQLQMTLYTEEVKNFVGIALSRTVSKIHPFLHFTQNFKMASENGGKNIFGK